MGPLNPSPSAPGLASDNKTFSAVMPAPFGAIGITTNAHWVVALDFLPASHPLQQPANPLAAVTVEQIDAYLADADYRFDLPLDVVGSAFRRRVWQAIAAIPCGQTLSYGALAQQIGSVARAVGQACGDNPFPLVIPCHRVVAARGLGGFDHHAAGHSITTKQWLLRHEGVF